MFSIPSGHVSFEPLWHHIAPHPVRVVSMVIISLWLFYSQLDSSKSVLGLSFLRQGHIPRCGIYKGAAVCWFATSGILAALASLGWSRMRFAPSVLASAAGSDTARWGVAECCDEVASILSVSSLIPMNCLTLPCVREDSSEFIAAASTITWSRRMDVFWIACSLVKGGTIQMSVAFKGDKVIRKKTPMVQSRGRTAGLNFWTHLCSGAIGTSMPWTSLVFSVLSPLEGGAFFKNWSINTCYIEPWF